MWLAQNVTLRQQQERMRSENKKAMEQVVAALLTSAVDLRWKQQLEKRGTNTLSLTILAGARADAEAAGGKSTSLRTPERDGGFRALPGLTNETVGRSRKLTSAFAKAKAMDRLKEERESHENQMQWVKQNEMLRNEVPQTQGWSLV